MNLYIIDTGCKISLSNQKLIVVSEEGRREFPLGMVESLTIGKTVQITSQAICALSESGISVAWISRNGIICQTFGEENLFYQQQQFRSLDKPGFLLELTRKNTAAKIENQFAFIGKSREFRRNDIEKCASVNSLLGVEGVYAARYFSELKALFPEKYHFHGRKKHPAPDSVNSVLSFSYTLLYRKITDMIAVHGLNPSVGFCHCLKAGHYALSSDIMESLRSIICDETAVRAFLEGFSEEDFQTGENGVYLSGKAKQCVIGIFHEKLREKAETRNGFSGDYTGVIEQIICSYIRAVENFDAALYTPYRKEKQHVQEKFSCDL